MFFSEVVAMAILFGTIGVVWVDRSDPTEVAAWNRAVAETWRSSARRALGSS